MAQKGKEEHLFAPDKIEWMLAEGLESMEPGERQILLVMAETKIQDGYKPTNEEKRVVEGLRNLAGDDYDAKDINRKVRTMVKSRTRPNTTPLKLPPVFDRLLNRFRRSKEE